MQSPKQQTMSEIETNASASARIEVPFILLNILPFLTPIELALLPQVSKSTQATFSQNEGIIYRNALKFSFLPTISLDWPRLSPNASPKLYCLDLLASVAKGKPRDELSQWHTLLERMRTIESIDTIRSFLSRSHYGTSPWNSLLLHSRGTYFCPICVGNDEERLQDRKSKTQNAIIDELVAGGHTRSITISSGDPCVPLEENEEINMIFRRLRWEPSLGNHRFILNCNLGCGFCGELSFDVKLPRPCKSESECLTSYCDYCEDFCCNCYFSICNICNTNRCDGCFGTCQRCFAQICTECIRDCERCELILCDTCCSRCTTCDESLCRSNHGIEWSVNPLRNELYSTCERCFHASCDRCHAEICDGCSRFCGNDDCMTSMCKRCSKQCKECHKPLCAECRCTCKKCKLVTCFDCLNICESCETVECTTCTELCSFCDRAMCSSCTTICGTCESDRACNSCDIICISCENKICAECSNKCVRCEKFICVECLNTCDVCEGIVCEACNPLSTCELCEGNVCEACNPLNTRTCELCYTNTCSLCSNSCEKCRTNTCTKCSTSCEKCSVNICQRCSCCCETCNITTCKTCSSSVCERCSDQAAETRQKIIDWYATSSELTYRLSFTLDVPLEQRLAMPLQDAQDWLTGSFESAKRVIQNLHHSSSKKATTKTERTKRPLSKKLKGSP